MELIEFEKADSGIDSDDTNLLFRRRMYQALMGADGRREMELSGSEDGTDDESLRNERSLLKNYKVSDNPYFRAEQRSSTPWPEEIVNSPGRTSPPLYEVELTASDEEDDGSVLELVIPVRSPRYPKVNSKFVPKILCTFLCCFPK